MLRARTAWPKQAFLIVLIHDSSQAFDAKLSGKRVRGRFCLCRKFWQVTNQDIVSLPNYRLWQCLQLVHPLSSSQRYVPEQSFIRGFGWLYSIQNAFSCQLSKLHNSGGQFPKVRTWSFPFPLTARRLWVVSCQHGIWFSLLCSYDHMSCLSMC